MKHLIQQLNFYSGAIGIVITLVTGIWALLKLREYLKDKRFRTYHELIDEMVNETRNPDRVIKLDRQIAVIFELRNFPSYYPLTARILTDLKEAWKDQTRAVKEINLTLDFISKSWLTRAYRRFMKK